MTKKVKYSSSIIILLGFVFLITACSPAITDDRYTDDRFYVDMQIAGEGKITDGGHQTLMTSNTITTNRNKEFFDKDAFVTLIAKEHDTASSDFLFWLRSDKDGITTENLKINQNTQVISVFGNPNEDFIIGNVTQAFGSKDVIGYWKALVGSPYLELYARTTRDFAVEEDYIFDKDLPQETKYYRAQSADQLNNEFIAAMTRIEEIEDASKYVFVYVDDTENENSFKTLLLDANSPTNTTLYEGATAKSGNDFIDAVELIIDEQIEKNHPGIMLGNVIDNYPQTLQ